MFNTFFFCTVLMAAARLGYAFCESYELFVFLNIVNIDLCVFCMVEWDSLLFFFCCILSLLIAALE